MPVRNCICGRAYCRHGHEICSCGKRMKKVSARNCRSCATTITNAKRYADREPTLLVPELEKRIDFSGECWIWTGARKGAEGYGSLSLRGTHNAHRLVYETLVGPIPEGLDLDHLCRVRYCVNPAHLEPVTRRENLRRGREFRTKEAA